MKTNCSQSQASVSMRIMLGKAKPNQEAKFITSPFCGKSLRKTKNSIFKYIFLTKRLKAMDHDKKKFWIKLTGSSVPWAPDWDQFLSAWRCLQCWQHNKHTGSSLCIFSSFLLPPYALQPPLQHLRKSPPLSLQTKSKEWKELSAFFKAFSRPNRFKDLKFKVTMPHLVPRSAFLSVEALFRRSLKSGPAPQTWGSEVSQPHCCGAVPALLGQ